MSDPVYAEPRESIGHRIVRAMFVVIFFQFFWKFGGLVITLLVGSVFGSSPESDAYFFVTETVVFLLQTLCLKIFIPVVVPIFKEQLSQEGERAAWRFASTVLSLVVVVLALVTVAGILFAPRITAVIAEGFNDRQAALTTRLMRFMFPGVFAICLATVTYALLNSYNVFGYPAAGDAVQKMLWAGVFFVASLTGLALARMLDAIAVAFLLGAGATLLTHLVGLRSKLRFLRVGLPGLSGARTVKELAILAAHVVALAAGLWVVHLVRDSLPSERAVLALQQAVLIVVVATYLMLLWLRARRRGTPMAKFAALAVPLLFGILFAKYRDVLTNLFASFTGTGVFSDLKYARKIGEAPNTLVIAALSIAILPHLCELATGKKWGEFGDVMTHTIRTVVIFFVPLAALTVVLRRPVIQLLFDRGNWSDYHLIHAGDALGLYILALPFFAIENPIQQSFFAMQRMWTPTLIGFLGTGFHILFLFVGIEWLGFGYFAVVALVYMAARMFKNIILLLVMRAHVKILPWRPSVIFLAKALLVTLGVVLVSHYTYQPLKRLLPLDPYRRREVMIDTFNVEPRGWESDNVDDFRIVPKGDPILKVFGGAAIVDGENALMARYRRSPRRSAGLRRDVSAHSLATWGQVYIAFEVLVDEPTELTLELVTAERVSFKHEPIRVESGKRQTVTACVNDFGLRKQHVDFVGLWIRDTTPATAVAEKATTLVLDNLSLSCVGWDWCLEKLKTGSWQETEARSISLERLQQDQARERLKEPGNFPYCVDDFEASATRWSFDVPRGRPLVEDTGERVDRPEYALHFTAQQPVRASTFIYHLWPGNDCDALSFKARADERCTLRWRLSSFHWRRKPGGPSGVQSVAEWQRQFVAGVEITPSEKRKGYKLSHTQFKRQEDPDTVARMPEMQSYVIFCTDAPERGFERLGELVFLEVEVPGGVNLWLDNVAFVREPRGPRLGGLSLGYEALKLVHVGVPSLAAFVAFVVLLFALRVEEAKSTWAWLRDRALKKVLAKLRRKG